MRAYLQIFAVALPLYILIPLQAQNRGLASIQAHDLRAHMLFLSSEELEGRNTGEQGLEVAARYLAVEAEKLGLKSADADNGFFQFYTIQEKEYDRENSQATITIASEEPVVNRDNFYIFPGVKEEQMVIEGEVVFAGYGIRDEAHQYNDFTNIEIEGKVVLIMNRGPMNEDGTEALFDHEKWAGMQSFQHKAEYIYSQQPKAILMVLDPKSGFQSIEDMNPGISNYLGKSRQLKNDTSEYSESGEMPKMVLIHRSVADQLLAGSGKSLKEWQLEIDGNLEPRSFQLEDTRITFDLRMKSNDLEVSNVFGLIEGSDPALKDEVVIYLAHYDHLGMDDEGEVFNGADDNASGSVALVEIAEAFIMEKKRPRRSVGFLWVSGEEIGLFGSRYFADQPLVPLENIAAVINLDMLGRTKTEEDMESGRGGLTIQAGDSVKVIGGLQSSILMEINKNALREMGLAGNYVYNDLNHPGNYFYRSDHVSFAQKDIPVLFYSTGTHRDYHRVTDVEERIDYEKFLKMTRFCYHVGYRVAQYKDPIQVDNPMSGW